MSKWIIALAALVALPGSINAETLATVGTKTITRSDVETQVKSELAEVEQARYTALRGGLQELVAESLFEQEAKARGISVEELQKVEIVDKVAAPTDAEMQKLFDENKEQLQGATLDQVKDQLSEYLLRRAAEARRQALIDELKKKYPTKIALRPPLVVVELGPLPAKGPAKAPITIVEFSDYECPFCKKAEPVVAEVLKAYPDKIRIAYRNFPLPFHPAARPAAEAAACAAEQGKFWEYHQKLMESTDLTPETLNKLAVEVKIDPKKFEECVKSAKFAAQIDKDIAAGQAAGVNGTPAFFINGRMLDGAQPFENFKSIIDEELEFAGSKG